MDQNQPADTQPDNQIWETIRNHVQKAIDSGRHGIVISWISSNDVGCELKLNGDELFVYPPKQLINLYWPRLMKFGSDPEARELGICIASFKRYWHLSFSSNVHAANLTCVLQEMVAKLLLE